MRKKQEIMEEVEKNSMQFGGRELAKVQVEVWIDIRDILLEVTNGKKETSPKPGPESKPESESSGTASGKPKAQE